MTNSSQNSHRRPQTVPPPQSNESAQVNSDNQGSAMHFQQPGGTAGATAAVVAASASNGSRKMNRGIEQSETAASGQVNSNSGAISGDSQEIYRNNNINYNYGSNNNNISNNPNTEGLFSTSMHDWQAYHNYNMHKMRLDRIKKKPRSTFIPETLPGRITDPICMKNKQVVNLKGKMQAEEKKTEIERENVILLNKISKIMMNKKPANPAPVVTLSQTQPNQHYNYHHHQHHQNLNQQIHQNLMHNNNHYDHFALQQQQQQQLQQSSQLSTQQQQQHTLSQKPQEFVAFHHNPHAFSNNFLQSSNSLGQQQQQGNGFTGKNSSKSLNREVRYRNLVKIASENQEILYRIKNKRSEYSTNKLIQSSEAQERMLSNISKFKRSPSKIQRRRVSSAKPFNSNNLQNKDSNYTIDEADIKTERRDESGIYDNSQVYDMIQSYKDQRAEQNNSNNSVNHPQQQQRSPYRSFRSMKSASYQSNHKDLIYSVNRLARQQGYYSPYEPRLMRFNQRNGSIETSQSHHQNDHSFDQEIDFKSRTQVYKDQISIGENPCIVEVSRGQRIADDKTFRLILNEQQSVKVFSKINYQFELLPQILHIQNSAMVLTLEDHNQQRQVTNAQMSESGVQEGNGNENNLSNNNENNEYQVENANNNDQQNPDSHPNEQNEQDVDTEQVYEDNFENDSELVQNNKNNSSNNNTSSKTKSKVNQGQKSQKQQHQNQDESEQIEEIDDYGEPSAVQSPMQQHSSRVKANPKNDSSKQPGQKAKAGKKNEKPAPAQEIEDEIEDENNGEFDEYIEEEDLN